MYELPHLVLYGYMRKLHGHKGEVVIELASDAFLDADPEFVFVEIDGIPVPFAVESLRGDISRLILKLDKVDSEEEASRLRGCRVLIATDDLPDFEEDDEGEGLIGYTLIHPKEGRIGIVSDIDDSTSNILLLIKLEAEGTDLILPLVEDWVVSINDQNREIVYDYPAELTAL